VTGKGKSLWGRWRHSAGFTLIELLIALALFSLLSLALLGSVRVGTTAWARVTSNAEENDTSLHAQDLLRHLIEDAYPLFLSDDPTRRHVDFDGDKRSLTFLTSAPMALRRGGRSRVALSVERHEDRVDLMLVSNPELAIGNNVAASARKPLLSGASAVEFSYLGKLPSGNTAEWRDRWTSGPELPRLIRVHVQFSTNDGRDWPDLVVAPRIAADVGCVLDLLTTQCVGR
jgi:general secretion pathway protein J